MSLMEKVKELFTPTFDAGIEIRLNNTEAADVIRDAMRKAGYILEKAETRKRVSYTNGIETITVLQYMG